MIFASFFPLTSQKPLVYGLVRPVGGGNEPSDGFANR